jgi:hypothetical protein
MDWSNLSLVSLSVPNEKTKCGNLSIKSLTLGETDSSNGRRGFKFDQLYQTTGCIWDLGLTLVKDMR